jgi:hypothetical protein
MQSLGGCVEQRQNLSARPEENQEKLNLGVSFIRGQYIDFMSFIFSRRPV